MRELGSHLGQAVVKVPGYLGAVAKPAAVAGHRGRVDSKRGRYLLDPIGCQTIEY